MISKAIYILIIAALSQALNNGFVQRRETADDLQQQHELRFEDDEFHGRFKRDSSGSSRDEISNLTSAFELQNSHLHLTVHWTGKGRNTVFCLGRDQEMKSGATSQFFVSNDYGKTFDDFSDKFRLNDEDGGKPAVIRAFFHHPKSNCRYVFVDVMHNYTFTTDDCAKNIKGRKLEFRPDHVEFDPISEPGEIFLVHDRTDPESKLFVTKNFGETFSRVETFVQSFFFLPSDEAPASTAPISKLLVQRLKPNNMSTILMSPNYFQRQVDTFVLYNDAHEFEYRNNFMFVTRKNPSNESLLELYLSQAGERFVLADFGAQSNLDYHVVDVTDEGQIMVVVNHDHTSSNLYVSTKLTPYQAEFSMSLEKVMYYNPKVTWKNSWLSVTAGDTPFADVYKVQGLRGIYIASVLDKSVVSTVAVEAIKPEHLQSVITFDMGGTWSRIRAPEADEEGFPFAPCEVGKKCTLHISQQLSKKFPSTRSVPVFSSKSAVGVVVASGNVGPNLDRGPQQKQLTLHKSRRSNVFLSNDAG